MGCDIHMTVERRVNGAWERVDELPPRPCSHCGGAGRYSHSGNECYSCKGVGKQTGSYHDRNYNVSSVLADVRNDGNVTPITQPRGLPADMVPERAEAEEDEGSPDWHGDHSHSWLTVAELLAYDWKQVIRDEGFVIKETFAKWDAAGASGSPGEWCASVSGPMVRHVSNSEMRRRIREPYAWEAGDRAYTLIQWTVPLNLYAKHFLSFLETLSGLGAPDDVRIVFGFDS